MQIEPPSSLPLPLPLLSEPPSTEAKILAFERDITGPAKHASCPAPEPPSAITVPLTQTAVVTPEVGKNLAMSLKTIPVREPTAGEVILRILYTGICCSDAIFSIGPRGGFPSQNHIAGHEGIGYIVKSHAPNSLSSCTQLYGIRYLAWSCGSCTYCLRGLQTSCPFQLNTPKQIPGSFQEYITVPRTVLVPLPLPLPLPSTAILKDQPDTALYATALCSGSTALASVRATCLNPGDVLVVIGAMGAIGHLAGMVAKNVFGAKVIGVDLPGKVCRAARAEYMEYCDGLLAAPQCHQGAAWDKFCGALLQACADLRSEQNQQRGGRGVARAAEAVLVASSGIEAFQRLDEYVCDGGRIVCAGMPKGLNMVSLPLHCLVERNLHLTGNLMGGHEEALEMIELIRKGQITPHITRVRLEDIPRQMEAVVNCQTVGKVVVCL
ncbi:chaperonin 10-like protein [Aspergillus venezuelensis]